MEITASYSRKLNHALYGGGDYENSDHFCSMKTETEEPEEAYIELYNACVDSVTKSIAMEIASWTGDLSQTDTLEWIKNYCNDVDVLGEEYERMSKHSKDIIQELKKLKKRHSYQLTKSQ